MIKRSNYQGILKECASESASHSKINPNSKEHAILLNLVENNRKSISNNGYTAVVGGNRIYVYKSSGKLYGEIPFGSHIQPVVLKTSSNVKGPVLEAIYFDKQEERFCYCRDSSDDIHTGLGKKRKC